MTETEFVHELFMQQITRMTKKTPIPKNWHQ
jgi:hypothetical protein